MPLIRLLVCIDDTPDDELATESQDEKRSWPLVIFSLEGVDGDVLTLNIGTGGLVALISNVFRISEMFNFLGSPKRESRLVLISSTTLSSLRVMNFLTNSSSSRFTVVVLMVVIVLAASLRTHLARSVMEGDGSSDRRSTTFGTILMSFRGGGGGGKGSSSITSTYCAILIVFVSMMSVGSTSL